jgi:hypothetical protein
MPRLGTALSARIHLAVQLGALLVPSLLVTGKPNTFLIATSARMGYSRPRRGATSASSAAWFSFRNRGEREQRRHPYLPYRDKPSARNWHR